MSDFALAGNVKSKRSIHEALWVLVVGWFGVVLALGMDNFFAAPQGAPPLALFVAATVPVIVFVLAVSVSQMIRELALNTNLNFVTAVQSWRLGGYTFLILYSYGVLPGYFAWPAAVGDMFIGASAPLILAQLRKPAFLKSKTFIGWNLFGILDLVVAVSMGGLGTLLTVNPAAFPPATAMSHLPLVLIPTFFVPIFLILHVIALMQSNR